MGGGGPTAPNFAPPHRIRARLLGVRACVRACADRGLRAKNENNNNNNSEARKGHPGVVRIDIIIVRFMGGT